MRTIDRPGSFKRDYKRETKGQHRATLDSELLPVFKALATDQPLAPRYRDHDLTGDWINWGLTQLSFLMQPLNKSSGGLDSATTRRMTRLRVKRGMTGGRGMTNGCTLRRHPARKSQGLCDRWIHAMGCGTILLRRRARNGIGTQATNAVADHFSHLQSPTDAFDAVAALGDFSRNQQE